MINKPEVIVALDFDQERQILEFVELLNPKQVKVKIGSIAFTRFGPKLIQRLKNSGFDIFLDLKFHDIPNTVTQSVLAAADLGVWMVNVHALGGKKMMEAARQALESGGYNCKLIAVTILTSHSSRDLEIFNDTLLNMVKRLAYNAFQSGLDGVVCSAQEVKELRTMLGDDWYLVTPGISVHHHHGADQQRVVSIESAIVAGSSHLVIGRGITQSDNPRQTLLTILDEIDDFLVKNS